MSHVGLLGYSAYKHSTTWDEYGHLIAGISHWEFGRFDLYRVNPPLIRTVAAIPVMFADFERAWELYYTPEGERPERWLREDFLAANGARVFWLTTLARWAAIPFSVIGALVCYLWAKQLYGIAAGFIALTLWCFSPNILGYAALITPDVGAASLGVLAAYLFWRWLGDPSWQNAFLAGGGLGLALLSKNTWVIMPPLWITWWGTERFLLKARLAQAQKPSPAGQRANGARSRATVLKLAVMFLLAWYMLNLGYLFEGSFTPLADFGFISEAFGGRSEAADSNDIDPRNRFDESWVGRVPVPLPYNYVAGIDIQKWDFERKMWSYLAGEWRLGGWWYYYLYAMAIKMPIGFWLLFALTAITSLASIGRTLAERINPAVPFEESADNSTSTNPTSQTVLSDVFLLSPAGCVIILVSANTGFNHHLRYVLPAFPFLYIWVSQTARYLIARNRKWHRLAMAVVATSIVWLVSHSLYVFPHSLSYFSELVGGPNGGGKHLHASNVDWGQNLIYLKDWVEAHPNARPLYVLYQIPFVPLEVVGIDATIPPAGPFRVHPTDTQATDQMGPRAGWYAISVNDINTLGGEYEYFKHFEPNERICYSIHTYHITAHNATKVRRALGVSTLETNE